MSVAPYSKMARLHGLADQAVIVQPMNLYSIVH